MLLNGVQQSFDVKNNVMFFYAKKEKKRRKYKVLVSIEGRE